MSVATGSKPILQEHKSKFGDSSIRSNKSTKSNKSGKSSTKSMSLSSKSTSRKTKQNKSAKQKNASKAKKQSISTASKSGKLSKSSKQRKPVKGVVAPKKENNNLIRITSGRDVYHVDSKNFAACSTLIKKEKEAGNQPRSIDLSKYDPMTAKVLTEFIESQQVKTDISFFSLAELLKLANVFEMADLKKQLEKFLVVVAQTSVAALTQCLLIAGLTSISPEIEKQLLEEAAAQFPLVARADHFQQIPFSIMISVVSRCDLKVESEIELVDAMLLWAAGQPSPILIVPSLFALVRTGFLHPTHKAFIIERARSLRFAEELVSSVARILECTNGSRVCLNGEHIKARHRRCGMPEIDKNKATQPHMPLSIPREEIFYKPEASAPVARRPSTRSFYGSRSDTSGRSQKSQKSKKSQKNQKAKKKAAKSDQSLSKSSQSSKSSKSAKSNKSTNLFGGKKADAKAVKAKN